MSGDVTNPSPRDSAPLRVLLLDSIPRWGGGEKWCLDMAQGLRRRGHHVVIACPRGSPLARRAAAAGIETWSSLLLGRLVLLSAWRLRSFLARERIEAVIGNVKRDVWIGALARGSKALRLLQRRGLARPVRADPLSRWLYTRAVDRIIVNSPAIRDCMLEGNGCVDPARFVLIPNGIDTRQEPTGERERSRSELGLSTAAPVAASIGRLAAMKGHADLLRAWPVVLEQVPGAVLLLVGQGRRKWRLRWLARRLGLGDTVRFLGFRRDVDDILAASDLLVLPSRRDEGSSNALLEAMWQGLPAVVTRCGGLPAVVADGESGIVVPVGDPEALAAAIVRLLTRPEERIRLGAAARRAVAERFTLDAALDAVIALLESLRGPA